MATTKIWKVDSHLRRVVDYAKNENKTINPDWEKSSYQAMEDVMNYAADDLKTEQKFYVSGINCVPERAREMMMQTKEAARKVRTQQKRVEASDVDMGEIVTLARDYRQPENVSQTLNEIKNNMKLLEADLKGIQVDEEG